MGEEKAEADIKKTGTQQKLPEGGRGMTLCKTAQAGFSALGEAKHRPDLAFCSEKEGKKTFIAV